MLRTDIQNAVRRIHRDVEGNGTGIDVVIRDARRSGDLEWLGRNSERVNEICINLEGLSLAASQGESRVRLLSVDGVEVTGAGHSEIGGVERRRKENDPKGETYVF
jgi:hypothetical protein